MVESVWVGGLSGGCFVGSCSGAPSECKHWLNLLGGIIRVVFELKPWWALNVGINSRMNTEAIYSQTRGVNEQV
jgi:hypothetical protein